MSDSQKWMILIGAAAVGWLLVLLAPVLVPFVFSALLAYLGSPLVGRLASWKLSRTLATVLVFCGMFAFLLTGIVLLVPLLERQVRALALSLPGYLDWLQQSAVPWVEQRLGLQEPLLDVARLKKTVSEHLSEAGDIATAVLASFTRSGMALLGWLANLVLIPVFTFYLLRDWDLMLDRLYALMPDHLKPAAKRFARESDEVLGGFLRGQLLVMLSLGAIYTIGLWFVGFKQALLFGIAAGLVSFVPYLGLIVGVLSTGLASLMQNLGLIKLLAVLAVFGVGQLLEATVLTPKLVGNRIRLHPVVIILVVLAGGQLFGFLGILLALPAAAVGAVAVRHAYEHYAGSSSKE